MQIGGPLGAYLADEHLDTPLDYEEFAKIGGMIGHGGIVVFDDTVDMAAQARFAMNSAQLSPAANVRPAVLGLCGVWR